MKIGLQTWGSDGDILPFIALAMGLMRSGHDVTVVYTSVDNKDYSRFATLHDIRLVKAYDGFEEEPLEVVEKIVKYRNPLRELSLIMESHFCPALDEMYRAATALCRESDLVLGHIIHYPLATAAEKANCPRVAVMLCPMAIETRYMSPFDVNLGTWLNSRLWKLCDRILRKKIYGAADALRKREGLPPFTNLQEELLVTPKLTLVATTAVLCPRPRDWGQHIQVSGFLAPPRPEENWRMPPELSAFLEGGGPPVYFTFGSLNPFYAKESIRLFLEAAKKAGVRAIIQSDAKDFPIKEESPDVIMVRSMPHEAVFPHCAMIVHHGGSGTTQSSLKAGKPSLVVAHAFDQSYWGKRLQEIGVAGKVLHRRSATADDLAKGIRLVLNTPRMSQNARRAGHLMGKEDGVGNAVALIDNLFQ
jgi:UDP:flavonoid glycosyltransferase YjiC (YdhE family)